MSAGWLVYALLVGALMSIAALAVEGVFRARRWPTRWIWAASMAATLVAVAAAARATNDATPVTIIRKAPVMPATGISHQGLVLTAWVAEARAAAASLLHAGLATAAQWLPPWLASAAVLLWIASIATGLSVLGTVHLRLHRTRRAWPSADLHGRRVRVAPSIGPAVVGLVRPEIVVPRWLLDRSADEQRLVLAHEEEHVGARDYLLLSAANLAVALMPWHPAAWWSLARLRLALELDCDARVLRRGMHARSYGEMLIDLAGQCSGFRVGATALADKTTHLERRLLAMRPTTKRFTLVRAAVLSAAAALSLAAACEARVPTSAEIQSMDAASAQRTAAKAGFLDAHGAKTEFYVNDVRVSAAEAHSIAPNDIATINVEKGAGADAASIVRVKTLAVGKDGMKYRTGNPEAPALSEGESRARRLHEKMSLSHDTFAGVILIDGARADPAALHKLDPKNIVSVEIIKGAAASQLSADPAAKEGVIKVVTKR